MIRAEIYSAQLHRLLEVRYGLLGPSDPGKSVSNGGLHRGLDHWPILKSIGDPFPRTFQCLSHRQVRIRFELGLGLQTAVGLSKKIVLQKIINRLGDGGLFAGSMRGGSFPEKQVSGNGKSD